MAHRSSPLKYAANAATGALISAADMAVDVATEPVSISDCLAAAFQFVWANGGAPVGTVSVEGSLDGVNFSAMPFMDDSGAYVTSLAVSGNNGNHVIDIPITGVAYVRGVWDRTSGDGDLTILYRVKGS